MFSKHVVKRLLPLVNSNLSSTSAFKNLYSTSTSSDCVVLDWDEQNDKIAIVRLNRPDKLNALTEEVGDVFEKMMKQLATYDESRLAAVVITGNGRAFSAGGDLDFLKARIQQSNNDASSNKWQRGSFNNVAKMRSFYSRFLSLRSVPVPVISAINGAAVGAGMCLAMATDLRVASAKAKLGFNFSRLGLHPGLAATFFLPKAVGPQVSSRLLLTGELIEGAVAKEWGLVCEALPDGPSTLSKALDIARQIGETSPVASRTLINTLRLQQEVGLESALAREADCQAISYASPDLTEGLAAVIEKRTPNFK